MNPDPYWKEKLPFRISRFERTPFDVTFDYDMSCTSLGLRITFKTLIPDLAQNYEFVRFFPLSITKKRIFKIVRSHINHWSCLLNYHYCRDESDAAPVKQ